VQNGRRKTSWKEKENYKKSTIDDRQILNVWARLDKFRVRSDFSFDGDNILGS